jgi:hypothetical protein
MDSTVKPAGNRKILVFLILMTVFYLLSLLPAGMMVITSPMAFDAGYSTEAIFMASCVLAYPVLVLIALIGGWVCYAKRKNAAAVVFFLLPLVDVLILVGGLGFLP